MKFNLDDLDKKELEDIFNQQEINLDILELVQDYLRSKYDFAPLLKDQNFSSTRLLNSYYSGLICGTFLDKDNEILENIFSKILVNIDDHKYINDDYHKILNGLEISKKEWKVSQKTYAPFECFIFDCLKVDENRNYSINPSFGYFKNKYKYPFISYKNREWMSLNPNEINTMEKAISNAKGNCLVLGLGLGYFAFKISQKVEVKKITIVEIDKEEIDMFEKYILPLFPNKTKIEIINSDAIEFIKNKINYDYCFADIWHDVGDGLPLYRKIRCILDSTNIKTDYWIEESLLAYYRLIIIAVMKMEYSNASIPNSDEYLLASFKMRKECFNSIEQIKDFLKDENIHRLII